MKTQAPRAASTYHCGFQKAHGCKLGRHDCHHVRTLSAPLRNTGELIMQRRIRSVLQLYRSSCGATKLFPASPPVAPVATNRGARLSCPASSRETDEPKTQHRCPTPPCPLRAPALFQQQRGSPSTRSSLFSGTRWPDPPASAQTPPRLPRQTLPQLVETAVFLYHERPRG